MTVYFRSLGCLESSVFHLRFYAVSECFSMTFFSDVVCSSILFISLKICLMS